MMVRKNSDPYLVLGVTAEATPAEITHAYRMKLRALHPDSRSAATRSRAEADDRLRQVLSAYAALRDPALRADHDRRGATASTPPPGSPAPPTVSSAGPISIPVTHSNAGAHERPPLWAGPVRRHR